MGLYDTIAGTADHLAGSTDEAVGRLISGSEDVHQRATDEDWSFGQELTGTARIFVRNLGGSYGEDLEDFAFESPDGGFMGNEDDIDVVGPSTSEAASAAGFLADIAIQTGDESAARQTAERLLIYGALAAVAIAVVSWVVRPFVSAFGAVTGN